MLPPEVEQKVLQGVEVVQVADCRVDHQHHLPSHVNTHRGSVKCVHRAADSVFVAAGAAAGAHLGDMFQELGAGEAVLCGATVCTVVEKTEERRVQLKQSTTDKYHTVLYGLPNIHTDTESICKSYIYNSLSPAHSLT